MRHFFNINLNSFFAILLVFIKQIANTVTTLNETCKAYNYYKYLLLKQCPASVGIDLRCVIGLPNDVTYGERLNCATIEDYEIASLQLLDPASMLELINYRDDYGRPWCMLSFIYSTDCVFSAKLAKSVFRVAPLFPKLKVIAVDVSTNSRSYEGWGRSSYEKLITQFGIASTPIVSLWENGFATLRLHEWEGTVDALVKIILTKTDLTLKKTNQTLKKNEQCLNNLKEIIKNTNKAKLTQNSLNTNQSKQYPTEAEFLSRFRYLKKELDFDWYFLFAVIALIINIIYFILNSEKTMKFLKRMIPQFLLNNVNNN